MTPRVLYLMPGAVGGRLGRGELARRRGILADWAGGRALVDVCDVEDGAISIESFSDEALSVTPTLARIRQAVESGVDAIIMGCFGDTMLDAAREVSPGPVVGPAQASMHYAAMLGERFSILTVVPSVVPMLRRLVKLYDMNDRLASILTVGLAISKLASSGDESYERLLNEGRRAIEEHGADTLILGCMSMSFEPGLAAKLQDQLRVPVLNPARIALDVAMSMCSQNLSHRCSGNSARAENTPAIQMER